METYIVSFIPGTSGRFISNIMYQLILDKTDKLYWSDKGSAHDNNTFMSSWDISECSTTIDRNLLLDNIEFYKSFKFKDTGVAYSHVFPNFDLLRERLPDTKIVIISFTLDNKTEISFNNVLKNFIPDKDNEFKKMLKSKFNLDADNNIEQFKKYTTNHMKATSAKFSRKDFLNPVVPEDYKEKTLTLMYSDLYQETSDGSYVAFDQLKKFLNKDSNNNVFENYKSYVDKRNMLKAINNYEDY